MSPKRYTPAYIANNILKAGKPIGETKYTGKTALHNPEVKSKQSKKSLAGPIVHLK